MLAMLLHVNDSGFVVTPVLSGQRRNQRTRPSPRR